MSSTLKSNGNEEEEEYKFKVLNFQRVHDEMEDLVNKIKPMISLPSIYLRMLLHHYKWHWENVLERYFTMSQEEIFEKSGIKASNVEVMDLNIHQLEGTPNLDTYCLVCLSENQKLYSLSCKHSACMTCWNNYIIEKVIQNSCMVMRCVDPECQMIVGDETVCDVLTNSSRLNDYRKWLARFFVESNNLMKFCLGQDCTNVISVEFVASVDVTCSCDSTFCFSCYLPGHSPLPCWMMKNWIQITETDIKSSIWMKVNSKPCPKCKTPIEKNLGCNHMTCEKPGCDHHFCWICLENWNSHTDYYKCSYEDQQFTNMENLKTDLQKLHSCDAAYNDIRNLLKKKRQYNDYFFDKLNQIAGYFTEADAVYIKLFLKRMFEYFRILMLTYVLRYFLGQNVLQTDIFVQNQTDLHRSLDSLCENIAYKEFESYVVFKRTINEKLDYCKHRKGVMYAYMKECIDLGYHISQEDLEKELISSRDHQT